MLDTSAPKDLIDIFEEARKVIMKEGSMGVLSGLVSQVDFLARRTRRDDLWKLYLTLALYNQVANACQKTYLNNIVRDNLRHVPVSESTDPEKVVKKDMSAEFSWISWRYPDLTELFGETSETFYYQEAKASLVPKYTDAERFPIIAQVLIESFPKAMEALRKMLLEMLEGVCTRMDGKSVNEITNELWQHLLRLYEASGLPAA
jgi:hypothetical protein